MPCRFCEVDVHLIIEERALVRILASDPPLVPGHVLVTPIRHIERPSEMRTDEQYELFDTVIELQDKILDLAPGMGCDVRQHTRPFLTEDDLTVHHVHYHILPRQRDDDLYRQVQIHERALFEQGRLTREEMLREVARLRRLFTL